MMSRPLASWMLGPYALAYIAALYLPILFIPVFSFNDSIYVSLPFKEFTWKWYEQLLQSPEILEALSNSLIVGVGVSAVATVLGLFCAIGVTTYDIKGKSAVAAIVTAPIAIPFIILGIFLLLFFKGIGVPLSLFTIGVSHVLLTLPFAFLTQSARLRGFDRNLLLASADLGETWWMTFFRVILRLAGDGLEFYSLLHHLVRRVHARFLCLGFGYYAASLHLESAPLSRKTPRYSRAWQRNDRIQHRCRHYERSDTPSGQGPMNRFDQEDPGLSSQENSHIRIVGVSKRYGDDSALRQVDLDIREGEFFSLLGPSGGGKTTLLKMLGGFERPTEGDVYIDGKHVNDVPPHKRQTNMVFQNYALFPHLNVSDNIGYGLRRSGLSAAEKHEKISGLIELTQLKGLEKRNVENLSGGQKQRVALARALAMDPSVLLLDEPLGALDKTLRDEMGQELRAIQKRVGITFVFVTHDQEEAMALSDRVAVLFDGAIAQVDTPRRLYDWPRSESVANFIGTSNLFDGRISAIDASDITVDMAGQWTVTLPRDTERTTEVGEKLRLVVRPERIAGNPPSQEADAFSGRARVATVSFRGDRSYLELDATDASMRLSVVLLNVSDSDVVVPAIGDEVTFSFCQRDVVLLS